MPLIEVTLVEGRSEDRIRALVTSLTEAATSALDAPAQSVRVLVRELPASRWAVGGEPIADRDDRRADRDDGRADRGDGRADWDDAREES